MYILQGLWYILPMLKFSDKYEPGSEAMVQERAILKHLGVQGIHAYM